MDSLASINNLADRLATLVSNLEKDGAANILHFIVVAWFLRVGSFESIKRVNNNGNGF
jgi:hypothetical protein